MKYKDGEKITGEITALKSLLDCTDYILFRVIEDMIYCTSLADMLGAFSRFAAEYKDTVIKRREWRDEINKLEAELAKASGESVE